MAERWLQVTKRSQFSVGQRAKIIESYPEVTVTYEGTVHDIGSSIIEIGDDRSYVSAWMPDCGREVPKVEAYVAPRSLPTKPGTIIEFYDRDFLIDRTATLGRAGTWWVNGTSDVELNKVNFNGEFTIIYEPDD